MGFDANYILRDSDEAGCFDFMTFNVVLWEDDLSFLKNLKQTNKLLDFKEALSKYSVIMHEYRHYFDMTHTVYGVTYLSKLNEALLQKVNNKPGDEYNFHKIKDFTDNFKKIRYPKYYNLLLQHDDSKKWELRPTIGRVFNTAGYVSDRPVLFARYYNERGDLLARHPFSMVSLLECSATLDEYVNTTLIINEQLKDESEKFNYVSGSFSSQAMEYIYNIALTEYSTCFHLVANHFRVAELQDIFSMTRVLLDLCLNFTDRHFEILENSDFVDKLYKHDNGLGSDQLVEYIKFHTSLKNGIKYGERSILFYILIQKLDKRKYNTKDIINHIDEILLPYGIGFFEVMSDAKKFIKDKAEIISYSKIKYFSIIGKSIVKNHDILKNEFYIPEEFKFQHISIFLKKMDFPKIEVGDKFYGLTSNDNSLFKNLEYRDLFYEIDELSASLKEFDDACFF
ncbi:hypothetical protein [Acinetobacter baumannii]|uniref:hypothetical protein n=1 Tax=Acinetobacter baumannii TaxID=470 RepID=UPI0022EB77D8|nr:hypothetical protein [Acinetobacter baumannii]MDA3483269.1 hypothetical protein [Acinetobacter baumannii]WGT80682.1 hypothetical protein QE150_11900 [Acinetobacter baumannii]